MDRALLIRTWPVRAAVLIAALLLAYWSGVHSAAAFMRHADPERTLRFAGPDAGAFETLAEQELVAGLRARRTGPAKARAQAAITRDAMSAGAFRVLALAAELEGRTRRADLLLRQADRLSRRDLPTRLVLIERAVGRNDIPESLHHYDIALRTSGRSFEILAPTLASAIANAPIADALVPLFRANPPWLGQFLEYAIPNSNAPVALARLMIRTRDQAAVRDRSVVLQMLERLTRESRYRAARQFLAAMVPGRGTDRLLQDGGFAAGTRDGYAPFDWVYNASDGAAAEARPGEGLLYFAGPEQNVVVASQLLVLGPGRYRLAATGTNNAANAAAGPVWLLRCAGEQTSLAALEFPAGGQPRTASSPFTVPNAGCDGQWLELRLRTGEGGTGIEGRINRIAIERAGTAAR